MYEYTSINLQRSEPEVLDFYGTQESIPASLCTLANWYDNPVCLTGPLGYIDWRNRFLGIYFWAPERFKNTVFGFFYTAIIN